MTADDPLDDGNLLLHWYYQPRQFIVENANPETKVGPEFLDGVPSGCYRGVTLKQDTTSEHTHQPSCRETCWTGWLLDVNADNQHVIYRIGEYLAQGHACYVARWPD